MLRDMKSKCCDIFHFCSFTPCTLYVVFFFITRETLLIYVMNMHIFLWNEGITMYLCMNMLHFSLMQDISRYIIFHRIGCCFVLIPNPLYFYWSFIKLYFILLFCLIVLYSWPDFLCSYVYFINSNIIKHLF